MNKRNIFLTGATGFIGSHIADRFLESGHEVKALVRPSSNLRFIKDHIEYGEMTAVSGDLIQGASLEGKLAGCDVVVHVASFVGDWGKKEDYYRTNIEGTKNLLKSSKIAGIRSFMLISSNAVLGEEDCLTPKTEDSPYNPIFPYFLSGLFESDMNHYRNSKMLAEKETIDFCKQNGINLTVVRPVWVYGPREFNAGPYIFCKSIQEGNRFFPGCKGNKFHNIYVEDLSKMILILLEKQKKGINIFNAGSKSIPTMNEFWSLFCDALGKKSPIYLPKALVYPVGLGLEVAYKLLKAKKSPILTRARVEMGYCNNVYDTRKIMTEIGDLKETSLKAGIEKTVGWWKENGYL
jgi:nucleoside-diphosphate-sugar epimerase